MKLVDGEMRLKGPTMFTRYELLTLAQKSTKQGISYISEDPTLTGKAFDEEGFFKSGDCAEMVGGSYVLHGRTNIDGLETASKIPDTC